MATEHCVELSDSMSWLRKRDLTFLAKKYEPRALEALAATEVACKAFRRKVLLSLMSG